MLNISPCLLMPTALKGAKVAGRRHREEGRRKEQQEGEQKNKKYAIVRVCQLRMIVRLVGIPPLVSSAGRPRGLCFFYWLKRGRRPFSASAPSEVSGPAGKKRGFCPLESMPVPAIR